jgi:hypothetical protein
VALQAVRHLQSGWMTTNHPRKSNMKNVRSAQFPRVADLTKNFLSVAVSAAERLRSWLLEQSWFQSVLMPALPHQARWLLRRVYLDPIDFGDRLLGRHDPSFPTKATNFTGSAGPARTCGASGLSTLVVRGDTFRSRRSAFVSAGKLADAQFDPPAKPVEYGDFV